MPLNLSDIAKNPSLLTHEVVLPFGEETTLRPLEHKDVDLLARFLENLSLQTRENYTLASYDRVMAEELCDAINHYDKLRLVVVDKPQKKIIALFEFSFDIPENDKERFLKYGVQLSSDTDCRMGPCIADDYQNRGVGSVFFPYLLNVAQQFWCKRMILWGGVFSANKRALSFYEKCGFKKLGIFKDDKDNESVDMMIDVYKEEKQK